MWRILQQDVPEDFVLATGEKHTVREFVELAFAGAGLRLEWSGSGEQEVGRVNGAGEVVVAVDPRYYRPTEVELLLGNPAKAKAKLGWSPGTTFAELVRIMVEADMERVAKKGY